MGQSHFRNPSATCSRARVELQPPKICLRGTPGVQGCGQVARSWPTPVRTHFLVFNGFQHLRSAPSKFEARHSPQIFFKISALTQFLMLHPWCTKTRHFT